MSILEHVLHVGPFSGYMARSGISGPSGSIMSNFLRNCHTDFQSDCASLQSNQKWRSLPSFSTTSRASSVTCMFDLSHSDWCKVESQGCFDLHFSDDNEF